MTALQKESQKERILLFHTASTFTLDDNVENLILKGSSDIDGIGNVLANTIDEEIAELIH